jgi:hypothetical protein
MVNDEKSENNATHGNCGARISDVKTGTSQLKNYEYSKEHLKRIFNITEDVEVRNGTLFEIECTPDAPIALNTLPTKTRSV